MNLTKNFTLAEMLRSDTADLRGIKEQYQPSATIIANLKELCENILQPLRDIAGVPIIISSGYRCKKLNSIVPGASNTSQHVQGRAADLKATSGLTNADLYQLILKHKLPFDQLIWEYGNDKNPKWVHVSYSSRHRRQVLRIR